MSQSKAVRQAYAIADARHAEEERRERRAANRVQRHIAARTNPNTGQPYGMERAGKILEAAKKRA